MLLSLIGISAIFVLSWGLIDVCLPIAEDVFGATVHSFVSKVLNKMIVGSFDNVQELEFALKNSGLFIFALIKEVVNNISFEGELTAGQILGPMITDFVMRGIVFIVLFMGLFLFIKLIKVLINKIIKHLNLSISNRLLGGVLGLAKGLIVFIVMFSIIVLISNILFIEPLISFVQSGKISNIIYEYIIKII